MTYLILKWVHILSAILLLGTGLGSAFYVWRANRAGDLHAIRFVLRNVIFADWLFTVPPVVLLPVTGVWLMRINGYRFRHCGSGCRWCCSGLPGCAGCRRRFCNIK